MIKELGPGFRLTLVFTILPGAGLSAGDDGYLTAAVPGAGQRQPGDGQWTKSWARSLIGQPFSKPEYFHPRPSAAGGGYDAGASSGSNLGPTSAKLIRGTTKMDDKNNEVADFDGISLRVVHYSLENDIPFESSVPLDQFKDAQGNLDDAKLIKAFNDDKSPLAFKAIRPIPSDAVTASSSGLDPHISPANAEIQAARVAKARGVSVEQIKPLIVQYTDKAGLGFLGGIRSQRADAEHRAG